MYSVGHGLATEGVSLDEGDTEVASLIRHGRVDGQSHGAIIAAKTDEVRHVV